uniref:Uncharacterized protein n=1 Tax=Molossus molossus TaxID=27622 RepID=A0A7J8I956_MOLMO|nr:hypothetical protein HJG59_010561 [Molossus molossus]
MRELHPLAKPAARPKPPTQENHPSDARVTLTSFSIPTFNESLTCHDYLCNMSSFTHPFPPLESTSHPLSPTFHKAPYKGLCFWTDHSFSTQVPGWSSLHTNVITSLSLLCPAPRGKIRSLTMTTCVSC